MIDLLEVAEATNKTGEVNVELFAGVETFTVTQADANIGSETKHTTTSAFHRITRFSLSGLCASGVQIASGRILRAPVRVLVGTEESNEGDDRVLLGFLT